MKLVILGAGASFDSVYDYHDGLDNNPWRPPLANELLDARLKFRNIINGYPGGRYFLSQVNAVNDIEEFFQKQWHFLKNNRAIDLMAAFINLNYCLADLMDNVAKNNLYLGLSNYDVLIQKAYEYSVAKNEDVLFVTFNYDTLLEYSLDKVYKNINQAIGIDEYLKYPVKIIKPHGSCNWVRTFDPGFVDTTNSSVSEYLYYQKATLRNINNALEPGIKCLEKAQGSLYHGKQNPEGRYPDRRVCFPQLLIPLKDKDDFILPDDQEDYLKNNLCKINEILNIGWKGTEATFQQLLKENFNTRKIEVNYVNANDSGIENVLRPFMPNATFKNFNSIAQIVKSDNQKILVDSVNKRRIINHASGTFSSYTINVLQEKAENFFAY